MARKKTSGAPTSASCVLYDPADGSIVHTHTVVRFDRGSLASAKELESEARASLAKQPHRRAGLQALQIKTDDLEGEGDYRVDVATGSLRKQPPRKRRGTP